MRQKPPASGLGSSESLWAISSSGTIWQINPLNRKAAPVLHLHDLPAKERQLFQRQLMCNWMEECAAESLPPGLKD